MAAHTMTPYSSAAAPAIRKPLLFGMAAGLCVAAIAGIVAIAGSTYDDDIGRLISASLGFALFSATAASGAMLLQKGWESVHLLGWATVLMSAVSVVAVFVATFSDDSAEFLGVAGLATLACSHASIVTRDSRDGDSMGILALCWTSILLSVAFAGIGIALIIGLIDEVDADFARAMGVVFILLLLTFALPPILRRALR